MTVDAANLTGAGSLVGYTATATGRGTTATDSNPNGSATTPTTLNSGASDPSLDFGYYRPVTIGDFVWVDTNGNGVQDSGEPGISGVTLTLTGTSAAGVSVTDHATTSGAGAYAFSEPPGTYTVTIDAANFTGVGSLVGYTATATGRGTTATDSNPNGSATTPTTLNSGASDPSLDFGYYRPVTIGDFVWVDTNGNGVQDSGELGISGVTLTLSGTTAAGTSITDHATTSGAGAYAFSEPPGTYTVTVDAANFTGAGSLVGYAATATGRGTTATDSNPNGSATTPANLDSNGSDLSIDFGFTPTPPPPTAGELGSFRARRSDPGQVTISWLSLVDVDTLAFRVDRKKAEETWKPVGGGVVVPTKDGQPNRYQVFDQVAERLTAVYRLVKLDTAGNEHVLATAQLAAVPHLNVEFGRSGLRMNATGSPFATILVESSPASPEGPWDGFQRIELDANGLGALEIPLNPLNSSQFYRAINQ